MLNVILEFLTKNDILSKSIVLIIKLAIVMFIGFILTLIVNKVLFRHVIDGKRKQQSKTIKAFLNSVIKFGLMFFMTSILLQAVGVDVYSLAAVAGIGSVAIGFGAQTLVKDVINGAFILIEEQFQVDDMVSIQGKTGVVEVIGLRTTTLRNIVNNEVYIIPNSQISIVTNMTKDVQKVSFIIQVEYVENLKELNERVQTAVLKFADDKRILSRITSSAYYDSKHPFVNIFVSCSVVLNASIGVKNTLNDAVVEMIHQYDYKQAVKPIIVENK